MAESHRWVSNIKFSILLKKGWFSCGRVFLRRDEFHIYMAQLSKKNPFKKNVVNSNPNDFENPPEYDLDEFSSWRNVWLSHLVLPMKLALKNKMYNTIEMETQDHRVLQPPKCNWLTTTISVHYIVDWRHMNFLCMFKLGCVSTE